jgi:hypothetical protein
MSDYGNYSDTLIPKTKTFTGKNIYSASLLKFEKNNPKYKESQMFQVAVLSPDLETNISQNKFQFAQKMNYPTLYHTRYENRG